MSDTIGFIGLGKLGLPIATNLLEKGHKLRVYNRTPGKADALFAKGAELASSPADAVTPGGVVISVLWGEESVDQVATSAGFFEKLGPGGVHLSVSTVLPEAAKKLAALHAKHNCTYVEAPVFGRPEAAAARQLWFATAGDAKAKERVRPLLDAMGAQGVYDFGDDVGAATVVKLAGNFLIVSAGRSMGEAAALAEKAGVSPKALLDMLTSTLFTAPMYKAYAKMIADKTATLGQGSPIPKKDIDLFKRTGENAGAQTPIADVLADLLS